MDTITIPARTLRTCFSPITGIEVRDGSATGDGSWTISGYAAVYDQQTTLFDAYGMRVREEIAPRAFDRVLERLAAGDGLVHLNHGHDMKTAIASTANRSSPAGGLPIGGLELSSDAYGLRFFARVDQRDPDAMALAAKMNRNVVNQASFAFTIGDEITAEESILPDGTYDALYRILEVRDLFDVCACAQGAYPQTTSQIRSATSASLRIADLSELVAPASPEGRPSRSSEGSSSFANGASGRAADREHDTDRDLELVRARAAAELELLSLRSER